MIKTKTLLRYPLCRGLLVVAAIATAASPALAYTGQSLENGAKVSMRQAEKTVKAAIPHGRITDRELEREGGGSGLRYSFDVKTRGKTREVGVDAMTGKLLENSVEGANPD